MTSKETILAAPVVTQREITHRLILEVGGDGLCELWNADHTGNSLDSFYLSVGESTMAVFRAEDFNHCIGAVVQPLTWSTLCVAEGAAILGSVNFPFLVGSAYKVYPQKERATQITVTISRLEDRALVVVEVHDREGRRNEQVYPLPMRPNSDKGPDRAAIALVSFREKGSPLGNRGTLSLLPASRWKTASFNFGQ